MKASIFSRLMTGYVALLVLVTGVSVHAVIQLDKVNAVTRSIIRVDNALIGLHKYLSDALLSQTAYEKKYVMMRDPALYDGFVTSGNDFARHLGEARRLAASPEIRELLARAGDLHGQYLTLVHEEAEHLKERAYPLERHTRKKEKIVNDIIEALGRVRYLSRESVYGKVADLGEAGARARGAVIATTAAALLLGLVLSVAITRGITSPLRVMKKKTSEIAAGVFKSDLSLPSPPEIGELARAINFMCGRLGEVERMKSDFYALMSHELRTPLSSIQEGTNLLLEGVRGEVSEKQEEVLRVIEEESRRLIELVNSLLDLSKLEAGMMPFTFASSELGPLIARAVREVAPLTEASSVVIEQDVRDLPAVTMDSERVLQALRNLIGNALKFTPRGGVVRISACRVDGGVEVSVADTGPGIPESQLDGIFDKYRQGAKTGPRNLKGTGLGLAIVKHVIQAHGGKVWAKSEQGRGCVFFLFLPA